jgi:HEAT repeat protein
VVANFSANGHGMDLAAMKQAVAAGVDGINVDYPRLGADAVGRPVEQKLAELAHAGSAGDSGSRARAILKLSHYRGFALESEFAHWLLDPDNAVSRAAAVALVTARPRTPVAALADALKSRNPSARANAAWALGMLKAPAAMMAPLLKESDPQVLEEALAALSHMQGDVEAKTLLTLLANSSPAVRGAAALALAAHRPDIAVDAVAAQLRSETNTALSLYSDWNRRGKPPLTRQEIDTVTAYFRCQVKEVQALSMLNGPAVTQAMEEQAFRPGQDFAQMNGLISAFQLWDRIGADARPAVEALGEADGETADRAEWMLTQGGAAVLPEVRKALGSQSASVRVRAIHVLAWQGDKEALPLLIAMAGTDRTDTDLIAWAIEKIQSLHPEL